MRNRFVLLFEPDKSICLTSSLGTLKMDQKNLSNSQIQCKISHRFWICPPNVAEVWENFGKQWIFMENYLFSCYFALIFSVFPISLIFFKLFGKNNTSIVFSRKFYIENVLLDFFWLNFKPDTCIFKSVKVAPFFAKTRFFRNFTWWEIKKRK